MSLCAAIFTDGASAVVIEVAGENYEALLHEARDRRCWVVGLQQLDERFTGAESHDARSVGIIESHLPQTQNIPEKGEGVAEGLQSYPNV